MSKVLLAAAAIISLLLIANTLVSGPMLPLRRVIAQTTNNTNTTTKTPPQTSIMATTTKKEGNFLTYTNYAYGINIMYPADWKIGEHPYANVFVVDFMSILKNNSAIFPATITLSVESLKHNTTLNAFTIATLDKAKQSLPDFKLIESNDTALAGNPAYRIVYTFTSSDPSVQLHFQSMNVWTIKNSKIYTISYTGAISQYVSYFPILKNMMNSFKILK
jgi:eukaryotic-like serine/threonine-protein kinase